MHACIAIDLSTRKIAGTVSFVGGSTNDVIMDSYALRAKRSEACADAYRWTLSAVDYARYGAQTARQMGAGYPAFMGTPVEPNDVSVFVESPVLGRGGAGATIPLGMICGAILAGAEYDGNANVYTVNNQDWKKDVVGIGNASKDEITAWVKRYNRNLYQLWLNQNGKIDQDIMDSLCINLHGRNLIARASDLKTELGGLRA